MTYSQNSCTKTNMGDSEVGFEFYAKLHSENCGSFLQIYTPLHTHTPLHAHCPLPLTPHYMLTPNYMLKIHY